MNQIYWTDPTQQFVKKNSKKIQSGLEESFLGVAELIPKKVKHFYVAI